MFDYPFRSLGHDKRALPGGRDKYTPSILPLDGPACQVRCSTLDNPF